MLFLDPLVYGSGDVVGQSGTPELVKDSKSVFERVVLLEILEVFRPGLAYAGTSNWKL